jgi:dihydroorotate dehydrogenase (fumarate)
MISLKTKYMGLDLKNPVIVGANDLTTNPDNLKRIEDQGAAAIVYKSLFEEQIQLENLEIFEIRTEYEDGMLESHTFLIKEPAICSACEP